MSALRRIALVGLPGSGKSSVAPLLARRLGWDAVDVDAEVAAEAGRPIERVIDEEGEPAFRELEAAALERVLARTEPLVIACGGGLIAQDRARSALLAHTCVVWLDAPDATLVARLGPGNGRPLLRGDPSRTVPELRAAREAAHRAAHLRVSAAGSAEAVAERLAGTLGGAVRVPLGDRAYTVEIRAGALEDTWSHLPPATTRVALIADRAVAGAARRLAAGLRRSGRTVTGISVAGGEGVKTWAAAGRLLNRLGRAGLRRHDCVVALGGGSVGDVAGFVAAVHMRGIAWVNVPTTLLAMVDSAIGGKTGVNLARGKNLAGAFWQPRAVVCDPLLLLPLADRPYRSAFAEIIKYAMIRDGALVDLLDSRLASLLEREPEALTEAVRDCCAVKAEIVAGDERESGERAILNYGHSVGHALEAATGFGETLNHVGSSRVDLQACKLEYSIVSPK